MKSWTESIIFSIICITIIEMILPEGNNKKYIKVVLGVYLLIVIVNPILSKITNISDLGDIFDLSKLYEEKTWEVSSLDTNSDLEFLTEEALRIEISNILNKLNYRVLTLDIKLNIQDESNAEIKNLELKVEKIETKEELEVINKVEINISNNAKETNKLTEDEIEKIKDILYKELEIEKENIQLIS